MKNSFRLELAVEMTETLTIHYRRTLTTWCRRCERSVRMLTAVEAAGIAGTDQRAIYRAIRAGHLHFASRTDEMLICAESLVDLEKL